MNMLKLPCMPTEDHFLTHKVIKEVDMAVVDLRFKIYISLEKSLKELFAAIGSTFSTPAKSSVIIN